MKDEQTSLVFEIRSGRTRFPLRAVNSERFLIGGGEGCDLRLGGRHMPPLHSIVRIDGSAALLEPVALTPPLLVNGRAVDSGPLLDGDRIRIGAFEFVARRYARIHSPDDASDLVANRLAASRRESAEPTKDADDPSQLSAAELASLIEAEEQRVEQFEQRQRLAADALLDAVGERIEMATGGERSKLADEPEVQPAEQRRAWNDETAAGLIEELTAGLNQLLGQAESLARELHRSRRRLADREAEQARSTALVFDAQQNLATRLERLVTRLTELEENQRRPYRKVA